MGAVYQTAKVVKHGAVKFGEWLGAKLQVPDRAEAITSQLEALADWVIDSYVAGVLGHLLGDLPTSGYGGTALRLMAPLSDRNFSLGWITADSSLNTTFWKWGFAVAGASWATTGAYVASWKPPETKVREYFSKLRERESFSEVVETIETDIEYLFMQLLDGITEEFWDLPLFKSQDGGSETGVNRVWFQQHIDPQRVFNLAGYDSEVLVEEGLWSDELESTGGSALMSTSTDRCGVSLSTDQSADPLVRVTLESGASQPDSTLVTANESPGKALTWSGDGNTLGLFRDDQLDSEGIPLSTGSKNETSLTAEDETKESEVPLRDNSNEE
ncbi:hypothetical protein D8Y22_13670 [Salinadaptatus halalkaliphilus]|uniref:Uncharacterized protein n=2 Tax=Salinadaptatus halalkaliphilus TaxID=2419781 RepID=A0A4S3TMK4_9EURY|nr:hypothetical protein D8Y22_13670 [Salinadaptatus halalkaliphilus]